MTYRVAAPAAWAKRIERAKWPEIAAMPWILAPQNSTHYRLTRTLFAESSQPPAKSIEADHEGVIANLVESEVGLALVREDIAIERQSAGALRIWGHAEVSTALWFIYLNERANEPALAALLGVLRETWEPALA